METMLQTLREGLPELKLELPQDVQQKLCAFGQLVVEQNKVMNLTAITEPDRVAQLHLLDSLSVLTVADLHGNSALTDSALAQLQQHLR